VKLSSVDVFKMLDQGLLGIDPKPTPDRVGGCSIDLRLGNAFYVPVADPPMYIDIQEGGGGMDLERSHRRLVLSEGESFYLKPGALVLGTTIERVSIPNYVVGVLDGRSSLARLGLLVHLTAHTVDPGWAGTITLELFNVGKSILMLRAGMGICAISFELLTSPAEVPYYEKKGAKYVGQSGPTQSRINRGACPKLH